METISQMTPPRVIDEELRRLEELAAGFHAEGFPTLLIDGQGKVITTYTDSGTPEHDGFVANASQKVRFASRAVDLAIPTRFNVLVEGDEADVAGIFPQGAYLRPNEAGGSIVRIFRAPNSMLAMSPRGVNFREWRVTFGRPFVEASRFTLWIPKGVSTVIPLAPQPVVDALVGSREAR